MRAPFRTIPGRLTRAAFCLGMLVLSFRCAAGGDQNNPDSAFFRLSFDPQTSETAVVNLINDARKSIDVSLYGFENANVASALISAYQRRGVQVRMSTEFDSEPLVGYQRVILAGIPVKLGNDSGIMHNKYFIVDKKYIVTGSTNLTGTPPPSKLDAYPVSNPPSGMWAHFNNLVVLKNEGLAAEFQKDFDVQWSGSYASKKETGYATLYSSNNWTETQYQVGSLKINAYFTPYQNTFASYRARYPGDLDCSDPTINVNTASSTTIDAACLSPSAGFAAAGYCYDTTNNRTIYRHYNADSGAYQCKGNSASYNDYRSALNVVIQLMRSAKKSVNCLFFAFTDRVIMNELKNAKARGLDVKVYMDYNQYRSQYRNSGASFIDLRQKVGTVKLVRRWNGGLNHHKVVFTDDENLILGSMNYSAAAVTTNDENFLLIKNAGPLIADFRREMARVDEQSFLLPPTEDDGSYVSTGETD